MRVTCTVNGEVRTAEHLRPGESLLDLLRDRLGLPGSKDACRQGECGSCTVYLDGATVCSCLVAAGQADGAEVRTVEGLAANGELAPVQRAFVDHGAVQCGFCTPGLVVQAHAVLERSVGSGGELPHDGVLREQLAGNLCRCTGYERILAAVRAAGDRSRGPAGCRDEDERIDPDTPTSGADE